MSIFNLSKCWNTCILYNRKCVKFGIFSTKHCINVFVPSKTGLFVSDLWYKFFEAQLLYRNHNLLSKINNFSRRHSSIVKLLVFVHPHFGSTAGVPTRYTTTSFFFIYYVYLHCTFHLLCSFTLYFSSSMFIYIVLFIYYVHLHCTCSRFVSLLL